MTSSRTAILWLGIAAAPLAWVAQLVGGYAAEDLGCQPGGGAGEVAGVATDTFTLALTVAALVVAALGAAAAAVTWRRDGRSYVHFLGLAGVLASGLFLFLISLGGVGVLVLDSCEAS